MSEIRPSSERHDGPVLVLAVGLLMVFLGTWAVTAAAALGWGIALALALVFLVAAVLLRSTDATRPLRYVLFGLTVMALIATVFSLVL